jgi:hypothetical protein
MSEPPAAPQPTERDRENERRRQAIALRQNAEHDEAVALALAALGPGWTPWMKISLIPADHRQTGDDRPVATIYKVYRGAARTSENALFLRRMPDGRVLTSDRYEPLFGDLLEEKHPTRTVEVRGRQAPVSRYEVVWSALELYHPRSAEQLAAQRQTREQKKAERQEKRWREENPLLAFLERIQREQAEGEGQQR